MKHIGETLLQRESRFEYSAETMKFITGKTVLVTGAGGSIGSELVRQCLGLGAARIVKIDSDEDALYNLSLDIYGSAIFSPEDDLHLIDVTDHREMNRIMAESKPDLVFHAAAKKHLPLTQAEPSIAVRTNVLGTLAVIQAAVAHRVPRVVNISTDKAADPSNVLGFTKRLAELLAASYSSATTEIASVRFGNVLGSRGSLLPLVAHQLEHGRPILLTDSNAMRYFMTIPEAASLVVESARLTRGGELFVLDMGEPIRIRDLIVRFAELSGHPSPEFKIVGLRPGEKLREVLFGEATTSHDTTSHPRIFSIPVEQSPALTRRIEELQQLVSDQSSPEVIRRSLASWVA